MSKRRTSKATRSVTGSAELEAGRLPCESLASVQTSLFGPEVLHVNRFRAPANVRAKWTKGTSGQSGMSSLRSAALTRSMESKLRAVMDLNGSMEYRLTWKNLVMPSGRVIFRLRASARPTSASGFGGWPTPDAQAMNVGADPVKHLARLARLKAKHNNGNGAGLPLGMAAKLAGWQTPTVNDSKASDYSYIKGPGGKRVKFLKLPGQAKQTTGLIMNSAGDARQVAVASGAVLNPSHSGWIQGYPKAWLACGLNAMLRLQRR